MLARVDARLTLSVSPPLAAMLADPVLRGRFDRHLEAMRALNGRFVDGEHAAAARHYADHLDTIAHTWKRIDRDLLGALRRLHDRGRIELTTTSVSHAYLPGLDVIDGAVDAQLMLGRSSFHALSGVEPGGCWLPECAWCEGVDAALARAGATWSILDEHAIRFAEGAIAIEPIISPRGVGYLPRDRGASHRVWSRQHGYPSHGCYREFYWDIAAKDADGGPLGAHSGLKYHRIDKQAYDPEAAACRAEHDANDFAEWLQQREGIVVAAYDAELFGHWWFEGPTFLEAVLRRLGNDTATVSEALTTSSWPVANPCPSSWGRGGYGAVWLGEATAPLWRHIHHAHRVVTETVQAHSDASGARGRALDQAIRELLLMQASDWPFMIDDGAVADFGRSRFEHHRRRALELSASIVRGKPEHVEDGGFLHELHGPTLRRHFESRKPR